MTFIRPFRPNYGTGADGSPASSSFTVAKQEYQWVNYTLDNGHTITLSSSYKPSIFRVQGTLTIAGTINGDGLGWPGGARPANGAIGNDGAGPGKGTVRDGFSGAGAGHATVGGDGLGTGGSPYNGLGGLLLGSYGDWCVGSGGASGRCSNSDGTTQGPKGGDGGPGLVIVTRKLVVASTAQMLLRGANGESALAFDSGGAGAGSGGLLLALFEIGEFPASGVQILATGGVGGTKNMVGGADGGAGAPGRVYLCYLKSISPTDAASRSSPAATLVNLAAMPVSIG